jgi:hypothetical protein
MTSQKIRIEYCTYFDKNYLVKGLCLLSSFHKHNPGAILWVLCFDEYTHSILKALNPRNVKLISLNEFEDRELRKAKENRSRVEYYWTCTPSLPLYLMKKKKSLTHVGYLDADLYFYSTVRPAVVELGKQSIFTVEHRYPPGEEYKNEKTGRFNVGFQIFKSDTEGKACLHRWRDQCIEWCYWKLENGKLGDQLYLNEWPSLYKNLCISSNLGINAAPWNIGQYSVKKANRKILINNHLLMCYHFHQFEIRSETSFKYSTGYLFSKAVKELIYGEYIDEIKKQISRIKNIDSVFSPPVAKKSFSMQIREKVLDYFYPFLGLYYKIYHIRIK